MLAVLVLGLQASVGPIMGTAVSHCATDNLAYRIEIMAAEVTACRYAGKSKITKDRVRRPLVIRGYRQDSELDVF